MLPINPTLLTLVETLLQLAIKYGPSLYSEVQTTIGLLRQTEPLTDAQIAQIEAALDKASRLLDEALVAKGITTLSMAEAQASVDPTRGSAAQPSAETDGAPSV